MADACVYLMNFAGDKFQPLLAGSRNDGLPPVINIGVDEDVTIRELAELVKQSVGYRGEIIYDPSKPDGTPRKLLDISRNRELGWQARTSFYEGIRLAYSDFLGCDADA